MALLRFPGCLAFRYCSVPSARSWNVDRGKARNALIVVGDYGCCGLGRKLYKKRGCSYSQTHRSFALSRKRRPLHGPLH